METAQVLFYLVDGLVDVMDFSVIRQAEHGWLFGELNSPHILVNMLNKQLKYIVYNI